MKSISKPNFFFFLFFVLITAIVGVFFQNPQIAMWLGFGMAAFSSIANDSIQTLGTFLTSNHKTKWWVLWLFIGGIAVAVLSYGWYFGQGDVSFERLSKIPHPETFSFFQVFAPAVLLLLTWFCIPVSTTFLILATFSSVKTIEAMLAKTFIGYIVAFVAAITIWGILVKVKGCSFMKVNLPKKTERKWRVIQWLSTGFLWTSWLMQDTANLAVYLPRALSGLEFLAFVSIIFFLLGLIFYSRGGRIQSIVSEKQDVMQVRAATIIDFVLAIILFIFKEVNNLPMSTTWVFLGVLAGREIVLSRLCTANKPFAKTLVLVGKDIFLAGVGLLVSISLAWLAFHI